MSVAHILAHPLITPKLGFIQDFSFGGGGHLLYMGGGMGMKGGCAPPARSLEALTYSKLRKSCLTVKLNTI